MEKREVVYWGGEDEECLTHETFDEAVEAYLDELYLYNLPETVTMFGFARKPVAVDASLILENQLEMLDENHGNPYADAPKPTKAMIDAANTLAYVIESEYESWACDPVTKRTVNTMEWVKEHRPDWTTPGEPDVSANLKNHGTTDEEETDE